MAFQKLNIDSLKKFPKSGVCDVCNKPISPGEAYIIDNYTFYHSPEYRDQQRHSVLGAMMGANMNDAYFEAAYQRDHSEGSAICPDCIHMFAEKKSGFPGAVPANSTQSSQTPAYVPVQMPVQTEPNYGEIDKAKKQGIWGIVLGALGLFCGLTAFVGLGLAISGLKKDKNSTVCKVALIISIAVIIINIVSGVFSAMNNTGLFNTLPQ